MSKSLKELFGILVNAKTPATQKDYQSALRSARMSVKNSGGISTDAPTQEGKKKLIDVGFFRFSGILK